MELRNEALEKMTHPPTPRELEMARELMITLEKNICVCDCLGCKTSSCFDCSADKTPPWKRWDMCFENDDNTLRDIIAYAKQARDEAYEKAAEKSKEYMQKIYDMGDVKVGTKWCVDLLSSLTKTIRALKRGESKS